MSDEDIRQYLNRMPVEPKARSPKGLSTLVRARRPKKQVPSQQNFSATHLFCPRCQKATPVRESVLLFLNDGNLLDYRCTLCGTSVGTRKG